MDCVVIRNVVALVAQRRGEEWHEPYRIDPQFLEIVELFFKPLKITDTIPVAVVESADVDLIDDRVLVTNCFLLDGFQYLPAKQGNAQIYLK
jgi:hypothetical protein